MHSISDMSKTSEKSHHKTVMALRGCTFQHDEKRVWAYRELLRF